MAQSSLSIGTVFTPHQWAVFALEQFGIFDQWIQGARVFDPTMGSGNLLLALVDYGLQNGYSLKQLPLHNLYGNELNKTHFQKAIASFQERYHKDMSRNFSNADILDLPAAEYDILFGNPPWQNFVDLPESYKPKIKAQFHKYDLTGNKKELLLGGSRIDIAALVIKRGIKDFLKENGKAYFFMPLSLLLNDGAHRYFRNYKIQEIHFAPKAIYDLRNTDAFKNINTRNALVCFQRDQKAAFPIDYFIFSRGKWQQKQAAPLFDTGNPLSILSGKKQPPLKLPGIQISKESTPRQGINTCGANAVFFFDTCKKLNPVSCLLNDSIRLPAKYVFPLLTGLNFKEQKPEAHKWVLLPYNSNGKPLTDKQVKAEPDLWEYLNQHKEKLQNRKGVLINSWIKRGLWWALLGVGPYNFMKYKVVWEAYGKKQFRPILAEGRWQANQALQAFMPARTKKEALRILSFLKKPQVENYLLSMKMEGTMNWAQPGKIKKLIQFQQEPTKK